MWYRGCAEAFSLVCCVVILREITAVAVKRGPAGDDHRRVKRIVGGHHAKAPPADDPVVFARLYNRDARVEGFRNTRTGIYTFLGIHYADPPVGPNRYARPLYKRLAGDLNATQHGPPCPQPDPYRQNIIIGNEDCLLLNVYTPQMPDETTGLPVYVWIHPGGFRYGSAAQYDATPFAQAGVIVVVPQYRLGSLGIIGDGSKEFAGNLAMFDMSTALRWTTEYIKHFGGDPAQMKVIGHGSGASSAMYLSMSHTARSASNISGVVAMSGTALSQYATDKEPVQSVQEIAEINGCPTTDELAIVKCLREKSAEEIIQNDSDVQTERLAGRLIIKALAGNAGFEPHTEGPADRRSLPGIIAEEPDQQLRNGDFMPVPLLTGVTKHETANAFSVEAINKVFGSPEKFLGSLKGVLKELTSFLNIDKLTGDIAKPILPGLTSVLTPTLDDLFKIPNNLGLSQVLSKLTEATTDVLFNLPAVLTLQVWSQIAPAFMYSFEYNGTVSKGKHFLRGLPIVSKTDNPNPEIVAHGDELGYMFDANDIYGNPIPEARLTSAEDLKVRKNLIGMLVKFAKTSIDGTEDDGKSDVLGGLFQSVGGGKGTPFIKVDTELEAADDFRFCELAVFGAALKPLTTTSCEGLGSILGSLGNVGNIVSGGVGGLLNGGGVVPGLGRKPASSTGASGLLGSGGLFG